ncbi:MAG: hypothetical protein AAFV88_04365 [Planctomycetota bacterium]
MSVLKDNKLVISANGQSDVFRLIQTNYKVFVKYGSGAAGALTFQTGDKEDELIAFSTPTATGTLEATTTAEKVFEMTGGGFLGISASGVSGSITITITELLP